MPALGSMVQKGKFSASDTRIGQGIEQSGLADIGQADDAAIKTHSVFLFLYIGAA